LRAVFPAVSCALRLIDQYGQPPDPRRHERPARAVQYKIRVYNKYQRTMKPETTNLLISWLRRARRGATLVVFCAVLPACTAVQPVDAGVSVELANYGLKTITDPSQCLASINSSDTPADFGLNPNRIQSLSWNLEKGQHSEALYQLGVLSSGIDLVVVQEAPLHSDLTNQFPNLGYWSFAPGYKSRANLTGVMTLSNTEPLTHCVFTVDEPWLGTPKATGVTEYALAGTSRTLMVINVHAVNFTLTAKPLERQLDVFEPFVKAHYGPVVISGDFNTWSEARMQHLRDFADELGLTILEFEVDHRTRVFGRVLDHVLVRDVEVLDTTTFQVDTSDHNALWSEFRILPEGTTAETNKVGADAQEGRS